MGQQERLDIYDSSMVRVGSESRAQTHAKGLWHQTFHCWVVHPSERSILLQLRHPDKETYPGLMDVSAAGHLLTGETVRDGVRELEEELGISVTFEELHYCGVVPQEDVISEGLIDREFNHVFIHASDRPIEAYSFQREEISGLYTIGVDDFKNLLTGEVEQVLVDGIFAEEASGTAKQDRRWMGLSDLTPNTHAYYDLLFEHVYRVLT
ncbi:NUDIX hydrolase [Paenibacillus sp. 1P07SE]|uniref:NUDIX hydrolase n=1 Tax=Paenibacillus sp. 1P07SE TaxID=3132209 RepID=UPI0039A6573A